MKVASRKHRVRLVFALGASALTALGSTGCGGADAVDEADPVAEKSGRVINVEIEPLQPRRFTDVIRLTGTVVADRVVTVVAEEGGTVREVLVDKGEVVTAGQPLLRLDDELLRAQRDEAQARSSLAAEMWQRKRTLYEDDSVGTEGEYLEARYAAAQTAAQLALFEARLRRTVVRAPFAGVLETRSVELGSVVAPGQPVGVILDLEPMKVAAGVPERYAADVAIGSEAVISLGALADTCRARVSYIGPAVHPGNRTFLVEFELYTAVPAVKPEMVADILLVRRTLDAAVVVPRQALVRNETGFTAFVVSSDGEPRAVARAVSLGPSAADEVVITSGLRPADRLIVVGQQQVADGDRVRIANQ